jgi:hypothetical protein
VAEVRECAQCGTPFTLGREHARFCSARCRMAWNREHAGMAAAPVVAIGWSVTAMTEAAGRLAAAGTWELPRLAGTVGKTMRRCKTEETLTGLRYVRNQLGRSADPAVFVRRDGGDAGSAAWTWSPLPEPELGGLAARARQWELSRYRAYRHGSPGTTSRRPSPAARNSSPRPRASPAATPRAPE